MISYIGKYLRGWIISLFISISIVFVFKTFVGMPTTVKGTSMLATLFPEDKLFLSTWGVNFNMIPKRGSIITFSAPSVDILDKDITSIAVYDKDSRSIKDKVLYYGLGISNSSYIKRVIGVPGDHVEIKNGKVYVNEQELKEDYLIEYMQTDMSLGGEFDDVIVPEKCVYVLGDNRNGSVDSRKFGCVPVSKIEGKVVGRWWPVKKWFIK